MRKLTLLLIALGLIAMPLAAFAAGSSSSSSRPAQKKSGVQKAQSLIQDGRYQQAVQVLQGVVSRDGSNADAYNLLGFSNKQMGNYDRALEHYRQALNLDPEHKGAHEYLGETYLALGQPAKAKEHLARLDEICTFGCEEYDELQAAIEDYERRKG